MWPSSCRISIQYSNRVKNNAKIVKSMSVCHQMSKAYQIGLWWTSQCPSDGGYPVDIQCPTDIRWTGEHLHVQLISAGCLPEIRLMSKYP